MFDIALDKETSEAEAPVAGIETRQGMEVRSATPHCYRLLIVACLVDLAKR